MAAAVVDHAGLAANFYAFAALNITGALLVSATVTRMPMRNSMASEAQAQPIHSWTAPLRAPELRAAFGIGFCILFAFIGTFTYVNFVLVAPPLSLGMMTLGFVYFLFLPSIVTTPLAGRAARSIGHKRALWASLAVAAAGLPLLLATSLSVVLFGLVLVAMGTFFAQALATGFVSRAAETNRPAASGLYLACYFTGGLAGSAVLGQLFDRLGWGACVAGIAVSLAVAAWLTAYLKFGSRKI